MFAYVAAARTFWCRKRPNTLKTRTYYPKTFTTLGEANAWVSPWVPVYNATPHSGINYYPPQAVLDGTWTKLQRKREEGMRNALSEVTITQLPDTKAGTGLPAEVSIIRTQPLDTKRFVSNCETLTHSATYWIIQGIKLPLHCYMQGQ
ncbi:hypothetical protein LA324_08150 [Corynebacterium coyleae]|uniref:hypothetical protein n=1 Tax=Corynebacterium coyleae TaxID=53374 RepID=UPI001CC99B10|nr:hypothetical protein [Corynebacterium coyleae]UBI08311.1 hypothetical protein LA324_08150 [Corynebacterium coyleae]